MKTCKNCGQTKPPEKFVKCSKSRDGRRNVCYTCKNSRPSSIAAQRRHNRTAKRKASQKRSNAKWYQRNKDRVLEYNRERFKRLYKNDAQFTLSIALRNQNHRLFRKGQLRSSARRILGCSVEEATLHLESLWLPGMSWNNYGDWEIDHVVPLSAFDLTDPEECKKACHYTNLQPLWAKQNREKSKQH